jgi:hypothetical protein
LSHDGNAGSNAGLVSLRVDNPACPKSAAVDREVLAAERLDDEVGDHASVLRSGARVSKEALTIDEQCARRCPRRRPAEGVDADAGSGRCDRAVEAAGRRMQSVSRFGLEQGSDGEVAAIAFSCG